MSYNIYNIYPTITLSSGIKIYLQNINLSHTYAGLLCGSPNEQINDNIISEINENMEIPCLIIEPNIEIVSENEFFGRNSLQDANKTIPLLPSVEVHALFESYEVDDLSFLNVVWFQDEFSTTIPGSIKKKIEEIDWGKHSSELFI